MQVFDIPKIWVSAHTTQFTKPGWIYLAHGSGTGIVISTPAPSAHPLRTLCAPSPHPLRTLSAPSPHPLRTLSAPSPHPLRTLSLFSLLMKFARPSAQRRQLRHPRATNQSRRRLLVDHRDHDPRPLCLHPTRPRSLHRHSPNCKYHLSLLIYFSPSLFSLPGHIPNPRRTRNQQATLRLVYSLEPVPRQHLFRANPNDHTCEWPVHS